GDLDIVLVGAVGVDLSLDVYLGNGTTIDTSTIADSTDITDGTVSGALGDVDNDGDLDMFTLDAVTFDVEIATNDGTGVFTQAYTILNTLVQGSASIAVADMDGDGFLDVVVGGQETGAVANAAVIIYLGAGDGTFVANTEAVGTNNELDNRVTVEIQIADWDLDGTPDVIGLLSTGGTDEIFTWLGDTGDATGLVDGGAGVSAVVVAGSVGATFNDFVLADINRDGLVDAVALAAADDRIEFFNNDDGGSTSIPAGAEIEATTGNNGEAVIVVLDINNDGLLDVAIGTDAAQEGLEYILGMAGDWAAAVAVGDTNNTCDGSLMAGDYNMDGRVDLIGSEAADAVNGVNFTLYPNTSNDD
ncbi:FG-GAP repeat domain-containing protein, partial [Planctomycetota bacterium]